MSKTKGLPSENSVATTKGNKKKEVPPWVLKAQCGAVASGKKAVKEKRQMCLSVVDSRKIQT